jgi:DNA-binding PadR family transcriptional regulator
VKIDRNSDLRVRVIKNFTDILVMKYLKTKPSSSGYQILRHLHETLSIPFSPGTVYNEVYMLERRGLIKSDGNENCRTYSLTVQGQETLNQIADKKKEMQDLIGEILKK